MSRTVKPAGCHKLTIMSQQVSQAAAALRDHLRRIQTITISWNLNFQRAVIRFDFFLVRTACGNDPFPHPALPSRLSLLIAETGHPFPPAAHGSLMLGTQTPDQIACVVRRSSKFVNE